MNRQTDGQMNRTGLQDPFLKDGGSFMFFGNSGIKCPSTIWLDCEPYGKNQFKKKEYNQHSPRFKEFKNNDPNQIYGR